MDTKRKRKEVAELIDNIKEHSGRLMDHPSIPVLELNVILAKITKLYEKTAILKYLAVKESRHPEADENTDPTINLNSHPVNNIKDLMPEVSDVRTEDKAQSVEKAPKAESKEPEKEKIAANEANIPDPAETSQKNIGKLEDYLDVNAKFSTEEDPSLSHQLKKQPISNLMTAIGLNERYLFANHLFDGNMEKFLETVKTLNTCESSEEAMHFFDNKLRAENNWEKGDELVAAFKLLVERRFH